MTEEMQQSGSTLHDLGHRLTARAYGTDVGYRLGAPALVAIHSAAAEATGADHFVTGSEGSKSWSLLRGLNTIRI